MRVVGQVPGMTKCELVRECNYRSHRATRYDPSRRYVDSRDRENAVRTLETSHIIETKDKSSF